MPSRLGKSRRRRATHVRREAAPEINRRKIPNLVKRAYEMVPSAIVMTARSDPSVVIHFRILQRIDPQLIEQCEEFSWKCVRSADSEIPTIGAIARIGPTTFGSPVRQDRRIAIYAVLPLAKVSHS